MKEKTPAQKVKRDIGLFCDTVRSELTESVGGLTARIHNDRSACLAEKSTPDIVDLAVNFAKLQMQVEDPASGVTRREVDQALRFLKYGIKANTETFGGKALDASALAQATKSLAEQIVAKIDPIRADFIGRGSPG